MELALKSFWPVVDRGWKSMTAVCSDPFCHNTQLMRSIPGGRAGIQSGDHWYCSVDCFVRASRTELASLTSVWFDEVPRIPRMSMGLTLLAKGHLTAEELRFAQTESELRRESLETTLIRHGLTSEKQFASARAAQWGYPVLARDRVGQMVESDIPQYLLKMFSAVPLQYSIKAKRILLGFVFRVEHSLLESIEKVTGCRAVPCFITATELAEQMKCVTNFPNQTTSIVEELGTPEIMARTMGRFSVEVAASHAVFSRCKNHVWARVSGKRGNADVIFRFERGTAPQVSGNSYVREEIVCSF
jgi:Type II secretion system (T2SS), protein E, N-terminal domain